MLDQTQTIKDEVSALFRPGGIVPVDSSLRGPHPRGNRRAVEPATEDHPEVDATAGPTDSIDVVNHPPHYTSHPSGVECIQITEWMNFNLGNAVKYIWRAGEKGKTIEDLEKARWYLTREIERLGSL